MRLVFIPAFACDGDLYEPLVPLLRLDFDCETVTPAEPDLAACAKLVLNQIGDAPFLVAGTSFGGHVAREVALMAPGQVRGLIVMGAGPAGVIDRAPLERRRAAIEADGGAEMLEDMARRIVFEPEGRGQEAADAFRRMTERAPASRLLAQNEALATRPDRTGDLSRITCPALLIWGADDQFSPPGAGQGMAEALPDARFVLLEECGHLPSLETPMRVAAEIRRRFVPEVPTGA
ncbi:alpha/beta fold hydrolase [Aureimonas sp. AU40]|uniref:alpha/beta fold hydrolase n=1 Tax=Aureimonas sp. AU40 TaxID=1637747 RepID=UPI0007836BF5|nr:alpha/beta hydrolase [Aureimonas sp. AU40]